MLYEYQALASPRPLGLKDMGVSLLIAMLTHQALVSPLDTDPIMSWVYPLGHSGFGILDPIPTTLRPFSCWPL